MKTEDDQNEYMEIGGAESRRNIVGLVSFGLLIAAVCAGLVVLFMRFTGSGLLALVLVVFMVGYMGLMAWWATRQDER